MQILELNWERERGKNSKDRPSKRMRLVPTSELFEGLEKLEEILNYEFRYKNLLLEALTYSRKIAVFALVTSASNTLGTLSSVFPLN